RQLLAVAHEQHDLHRSEGAVGIDVDMRASPPQRLVGRDLVHSDHWARNAVTDGIPPECATVRKPSRLSWRTHVVTSYGTCTSTCTQRTRRAHSSPSSRRNC